MNEIVDLHPDFRTQERLEAAFSHLTSFEDQGEIYHACLEIFRAIHHDCKVAGWWSDLTTGRPKDRNFGELSALIMSEICEAYTAEGPDDKLPQFAGFTTEIVDALIRLSDFFGSETRFDPHLVAVNIAKELCGVNEDTIQPNVTDILGAWAAMFEAGRKSRPIELEGARLFCYLVYAAQDYVIENEDAGENEDSCYYGAAVSKIFAAKQAFNRIRPDHKIAARLADDGKKI